MSLPEYEVTRMNVDTDKGSTDMLKVVCPRKGCGREHWVESVWRVVVPTSGSSLQPDARPVGRSCPYCWKAAAIPARLVLLSYPDATVKPKSLVVKRKRK